MCGEGGGEKERKERIRYRRIIKAWSNKQCSSVFMGLTIQSAPLRNYSCTTGKVQPSCRTGSDTAVLSVEAQPDHWLSADAPLTPTYHWLSADTPLTPTYPCTNGSATAAPKIWYTCTGNVCMTAAVCTWKTIRTQQLSTHGRLSELNSSPHTEDCQS